MRHISGSSDVYKIYCARNLVGSRHRSFRHFRVPSLSLAHLHEELLNAVTRRRQLGRLAVGPRHFAVGGNVLVFDAVQVLEETVELLSNLLAG